MKPFVPVQKICTGSKYFVLVQKQIAPTRHNWRYNNISIHVLFKAAQDLSFIGTHFTIGLNPDSCLTTTSSSLNFSIIRYLYSLLNCNPPSLPWVAWLLIEGFSQIDVQASCGRPLFKEYCFVFHMLLHKLFIWAGRIVQSGRPLFESWLNAWWTSINTCSWWHQGYAASVLRNRCLFKFIS